MNSSNHRLEGHEEQTIALDRSRGGRRRGATYLRAAAITTALWCIATMSLFSGCKSEDVAAWTTPIPFDLSHNIPWRSAKERRESQPFKMVAMWNDTVLYKAGQPAKRGFGGRVFFYGKSEKPVEVEGRMVVYAFDEMNHDPTETRPDRKFVFPAEMLEMHKSEDKGGASYSFWLPWDAVGGEQKEVSLIARFEASNGQVITGEQTRHILPGTAPLAQQRVTKRQSVPVVSVNQNPIPGPGANPVQPASYQQMPSGPMAGSSAQFESQASEPERRMKTTTITLPSQFGRALPAAVATEQRMAASRMQQAPLNTPVNAYGVAPAFNATTTPSETTAPTAQPTAGKAPAAVAAGGQPATGFQPSRSRVVGQPIPRLEAGHIR